MYLQHLKKYSILVILSLMVVTVFDNSAFARAGGGRSFGSRGSRGFSVPSRSYNQPAPSRQVSPDQSSNPARRDSGGFLRSIGYGSYCAVIIEKKKNALSVLLIYQTVKFGQ